MSEAGEQAERPFDLSLLLETLARHDVDYVVIGGVAVQVHGHRRTTMDLDLTPDPAPENMRRLAAALDEVGARHRQVHIHKEPKGARSFAQLRDSALVVEVDGIEVAIVSLDDLIRMKKAAGWPQDLDDIAALTAGEKRGS